MEAKTYETETFVSLKLDTQARVKGEVKGQIRADHLKPLQIKHNLNGSDMHETIHTIYGDFGD